MQEAMARTKFNLPKATTYIIMPLAFTGKDRRFKDLTLAYQFLLAEIYTANKAVKASAKLTYDHFAEKFGMSKGTVSGGLHKLEELGIIERLGNSRYKILLKFNTKDYVIIDDYLYKKLWKVNDKEKRLARSRILTLALVQRANNNPKTGGEFVSSQARIGKALGLPRTTAGDSVRELAAAGILILQKTDTHVEAYKRGLTRFTLDYEFNFVKRRKSTPAQNEEQRIKALFQTDREPSRNNTYITTAEERTAKLIKEHKVEAVDKQFKQQFSDYAALKNELVASKSKFRAAIWKSDKVTQEQAERELEDIRKRLKTCLRAHGAPHDLISDLIQ